MNSISSDEYHAAATSGDLKALEPLLTGGHGINQRDAEGRTPLYAAAGAGREEVVRALVQAGARVNAKARKRFTPLHEAARFGQTKTCVALVELGADRDRGTVRRATPLMIACRFGHPATVLALMEQGCDITKRDTFDRTLLHWAIKCDAGMEVVERLVAAGASVKVCDNFGKSPLMQAVKSKRPQVAGYLLGQGVALTREDKLFRGLLHMAATKGSVDCLRLLLEYGLEINKWSSKNNWNPLILAAQNCKYSALELLVRQGAAINVKDRSGLTPLCHVVWKKLKDFDRHPGRPYFDCALLLIKANADLDVMSKLFLYFKPPVAKHPQHALELATMGGCMDLIQLLARSGSGLGNIGEYFGLEVNQLPFKLANKPEALSWLQDYYASPRPIKQLCRAVIRSRLGRRLQTNQVRQLLSLPADLQSYLDFSDLSDLVEEFSVLGEGYVEAPGGQSDSEAEYEPSVYDSDNYGDQSIVDTPDEDAD